MTMAVVDERMAVNGAVGTGQGARGHGQWERRD